MSVIVCRPRSLPVSKLAEATRHSSAVNPSNHLEHRRVERTPVGRLGGPRRLAVVIAKRWKLAPKVFPVQFMDGPPVALRKRILSHMNAWSKTTCMSFRETRGTGEVRIARLDAPEDMAGYWSYIGTEIDVIDHDEPTMNLQEFTMKTPEREFHRVVRHETGHTLGFEHEHMRGALVKRIDRQKAFRYYDRECGWSRAEVISQVLTPLREKSIMGTTESDPTSIMCYEIPAEITRDGRAIVGGKDINRRDYAFAGSIYPKRLRR